MKLRTTLAISAALCALSFPAFTGCTSVAAPPTDTQQTIANAVEDAISIGLVPVLTKNPRYVAAAAAVAKGLGAFDGTTLTTDDITAFLAKTSISPDDQRIVTGIVSAAWATYTKRYAQRVGAATRPDVKLFLVAVANGISSAVAATPKPVAAVAWPLYGACGVPAIGRLA